MPYPHYHRKRKKNSSQTILKNVIADYNPLLGAWLIEMALMFNWEKPLATNRWSEIFECHQFCSLTGLPFFPDVDDDEDEFFKKRPTSALCTNLLKNQLEELQGKKIPSQLPLFNNINMLSKMLGLSDANQALLIFTAAMEIFSEFKGAIANRSIKTSDHLLCQVLARITDIPEKDFLDSISAESLLITTGLVQIEHSLMDFEDKLNLIDGLAGVLLSPHANADEMTGRFLKRAAAPTLTLTHFPHLAKDTETLLSYLRNAVENKEIGVNILFHGKPGVGKTEYVQSLAAELGMDLYEIAFADEGGDPIKGEGRLRAYNLCQQLLSGSGNTLLMFDEIEDVFPTDFGFFSMLFGGNGKKSNDRTAGKAWINRTMERNPVPAIWVCNRIGHIDPAYRRRFDYSTQFPIPPQSVRRFIAEHHLGCFQPQDAWIERIAANEETTPGQLDRAAKVARIASNGDTSQAIALVEQALDHSAALLGQKRLPARNTIRTAYRLEYLNTDADISEIIAGLKRRSRGTFCFHGVAGSGKSELARHIADEIDKPFMLRRASDILDAYLGESEKNIAAMFAAARQQDAVLVLDEADSFLSDRRGAHHSWEVTQVNELLTQMEAFDGIFICTTNLMEKLDLASLRRFAFKVRFDPMTPDQSWAMFRQELVRFGGDSVNAALWEQPVRNLTCLTPGDFAVAARQFELWGTPATPERFFDLLCKECQVKDALQKKIGFFAGLN
jgi:SpoVK/Ycf46/Vps4 family AAA+-type ATPase